MFDRAAMRHATHHDTLANYLWETSTRLRGGSRARDFGADIVGLLAIGAGGLRRASRKWRCLQRTAGAHETDLHTGACRYCGRQTDRRL